MIEKIFLAIYVVIYFYIRRFLENKYRIKEINDKIREYKEKFKNIKDIYSQEGINLINELQDILRTYQKYVIVSIIITGIFFFSLVAIYDPYYNISYENNQTIVHINNPLLKNSYFQVEYNNTQYLTKAENGVIKINGIIENIHLYIIIFLLPFYIPILNKNWIGFLAGFILLYIALEILYSIYSKYLRDKIKFKTLSR